MSTIRYNPNTQNNVSTSGPNRAKKAQSSSVGSTGSTGSTGSCNGGGSTAEYNASFQFGSLGDINDKIKPLSQEERDRFLNTPLDKPIDYDKIKMTPEELDNFFNTPLDSLFNPLRKKR